VLTDVEVALLHWPRDADERARLAAAMLPRLILVPAGVQPPNPRDDLEDWIRLPADERDVSARLRALAERTARSLEQTVLVDGRCVRRGPLTLTLSPAEAQFASVLFADPGLIVSRADIVHAIWGATDPPSARAIDDIAYRLRRRLATIGIDLVAARGRGFTVRVRHRMPEEAAL
jgi:two-component system response regulator TctD